MAFIHKKIKGKLHEIIFGTDTLAGKAFDVMLIITILSNSILIIAESVDIIRSIYGMWIAVLGWFFVIIFTVEYILRILVVSKKSAYIFSFFGMIDLLAILPVFLGFGLPQIRFWAIIRSLRLLRLFSILKMGRYMDESGHLLRALKASRPKITVFLFTILFIIVIVGSMMYVIEGPQHGFNSIPESMYWAIVTVSTVGYGDISPQTPIGKLVSSLLMIIGYGIIAVPTGIISHELAHTSKDHEKGKTCPNCHAGDYVEDDQFCSKCGTALRG
ncbi:ion transporter [Clostridium aceticum]|uniref:ion transporter n=1 Tax=Clostridium aceticum TaxID=84022 RepID=UPI0005DE9ABC|nr:ion transporter [Clostridium aceticum]KJF27327.1 ion transporter [Clostridium aceticum]